MRAAPFSYHAPRELGEALELLAGDGGEARVLAGGQSLIPLLNLRLARPSRLVDIGRIPGLADVREEDGRLTIGALVRHRTLGTSPLVAARCPVLGAAARLIGDRQIRARGTIGGSLAHADPAAELPAAVVALDGEIVAVSRRGERVIAARDFFVSYLTTALGSGEILTEVRVPALAPGTGWAVVEPEFKPAGFAVAVCVALVALGGDGVCRDARLAFAGVAPTPVRIAGAEAWLAGRHLDDASIADAAELVHEALDPEGDVHASGPYRRHMARLCARRALAAARERAAGRS